MKIVLTLLLLSLVGCTTVYKVDEKGICRAPNGKIVNLSQVEDTDALLKKLDNIGVFKKYKSGRHFTSSASTWTYRMMLENCRYQGGTCYGW